LLTASLAKVFQVDVVVILALRDHPVQEVVEVAPP
jgi:hypothetical protein